MLKKCVALVFVALCTYGSLQWEVLYYGTRADFYINMLTHFLGGCFTAVGVLIIRECINWVVTLGESSMAWVGYIRIPALPRYALVWIVLIVGLVWEVWEVLFRGSVFFNIDTLKDVIMDCCGAYTIAYIFKTHIND
jgi:hypothetical protein